MTDGKINTRAEAWRRFRRKLRRYCIWLAVGCVFVAWFGLPHAQWDYRYQNVGQERVKTDADYYSLTGKRVYGYGSRAYQSDFPILIFVPLNELIDWKASWNNVLDHLRV